MIAERSRGRVDSGHRAGSMLARRAPSGPGVRHCVPLPVSCDTLCNHITTQSNHRFDAPRAGGPHRASWRGPGAAARSSRLPPAPLVASASTSARRYRGLPASLRISGSRPRRAQVATAAEVTPNNEATCRRVIRSSPMRPPVTCRSRGSGTGRTRHKRRRPDECRAITFIGVPLPAGVSGSGTALVTLRDCARARPGQNAELPGAGCTENSAATCSEKHRSVDRY